MNRSDVALEEVFLTDAMRHVRREHVDGQLIDTERRATDA